MLTTRWHEEREQLSDLNTARERLDRWAVAAATPRFCLAT